MKWFVYKKRDGFWPNTWVAMPSDGIPGWSERHQFWGPRGFDNAVHFATQQARSTHE